MSEQLRALVRNRQVIHLRALDLDIGIESLTIQDFVEIQRQALAEYKRELLQTWTANADLLPDQDRQALIRDAFQRAEKLTADELPRKSMDGLGATLDYPAWWMNSTPHGRLFAIWLAMRKYPGQEGMTLRRADEIFTAAAGEVEQVADAVGELSLPTGPAEPEGNARRRGRRRRNRRSGT